MLPLLQQTAVAQKALNAANEGSNSLSVDAQKAQAALAVRITKVKEEWVALMRAFTESKTFQLMANTALSLASALIRIVTAAKELLPILTALMAIKVGKGMMGFVGGLSSGMRGGGSSRVGMARGGLVPGSGNRDTVPAVLTPGEFVIRKQSVNAIGAGNLEGMNRYATGRRVLQARAQGGAGGGARRSIRNVAAEKKIGASESSLKSKGKKNQSTPMTVGFQVVPGAIGGFILQPPKGEDMPSAQEIYPFILPPENKLALHMTKKAGVDKMPVRAQLEGMGGGGPTYSEFYPGVSEGRHNLKKARKFNLAARRGSMQAIRSGLDKTIETVKQEKLLDTGPIQTDENLIKAVEYDMAKDNTLRGSFEGFLFEGMITALTGATAAGSTVGSKTSVSFDFPRSSLKGHEEQLAALFGGNVKSLRKAEAKRSVSLFRHKVGGVRAKHAADIKAGDFSGVKVRKFANKMATGGSVTDTVPALLTPGEFVVNKKSSQAIGYGNLSNMNRYAAGGKVTGGRHGYGSGMDVSKLAPYGGGGTSAAPAASLGKAAAGAGKQIDGMGMSAATSMALIASMSSGMADTETTTGKVVSSLSQMVMHLSGVMIALEMFGIKLNMQSMLGGMGGGMPGMKGLGKAKESFGLGSKAMQSGDLMRKGKNIGWLGGKVVGKGGVEAKGMLRMGANFKSLAIGAAVAGLAFKGLTGAVDGVSGVHDKAKKAIEEGNVAEAEKTAALSQTAKDANSLGMAAVGVGAMFGPLGAGIGFAAGGLIKFASKFEWFQDSLKGARNFFAGLGLADSTALISQKAKVEAGTMKTQKLLVKSGEAASKALDQVKSGAMTAAQALNDPALEAAGQSIIANAKEREKLAKRQYDEEVDSMAWDGGLREALTLGGLLGEGGMERLKRVEAEKKVGQEATKKESQEALQQRRPMMQIRMRQVAAAGGDVNDYMNSMTGTTKQLIELSGETENIKKSFENIKRESDLMRKRIEALNLGMRDFTGRVGATTVAMDSMMDRFKTGGMTLESSINLIAAGMTEAGAHISEADFSTAIADVEKNFGAFGDSGDELKKFTAGMKAMGMIQRNMDTIFVEDFKEKLQKDRLSGGVGGGSSDDFKDRMAAAIVNQLDKKGVSDTIKKQFRTIIESGELTPEEMATLGTGNINVILKMLEDLYTKQMDVLQENGAKLVKMNAQLESLTKDRIAAEREFISAQRQSIDMQMEARKISAKYGGAKFGAGEKRSLLLEKANVGARGMRLSDLKSGGLGEIRRRSSQIGMQFGNIEQARRRTDAGTSEEMRGVKGKKLQEQQNDLAKANKDHANLIRELIKLEEEELQILEKKNALEQDSLSSLMKGDLEGFLKQQAAVGATAAIATGDKGMMGLFGADALGGAFENLKKMQEGGVQSIYGQKIGGAGGMLESAAVAGLEARGLKGLLFAQRAAGTTPEEEAGKRRIRGYAGALDETGKIGATMQGMKVGTADMRIDIATIEIKELQEKGKEVLGGGQAQTSARGGLIYANNGVFVPRGTDTVPAMLTPGEFVVRRQSVQRGNNLQILQAMNGAGRGGGGGYQSGGQVRYLHNGGTVAGNGGLDSDTANKLATSLSLFNSALAKNIENLNKIQLKIQLDTTNINVNLNGTSFLGALKDYLRTELMVEVRKQLGEFDFNMAGEPTFNTNVLQGMS